MGCCCGAPLSARPEDPSIVVYAPASQMIATRSDSPYVSLGAGRGLASVKGDLLNYTDHWGRSVINVYLKDIHKVSVERAFRDRNRYQLPCYCCPCAGCPDGIVDLRGTTSPGPAGGGLHGLEFHIGLAMPGAEEFAEKLKAEIHKASFQGDYQ